MIPDRDDLHLEIVECVDDLGDLNEVGPSPCDQINLLHILVSIGMHTHWMESWPSSRKTAAMTLWPIYDWENTRP
jgi:hypothetical protein